MANVGNIVKLYGSEEAPITYNYQVELCSVPGIYYTLESLTQLNVGDVVSTDFEGNIVCVKIVGTSQYLPTLTVLNQYENCTKCIACNTANYTVTLCNQPMSSITITTNSYLMIGNYIQFGDNCWEVTASQIYNPSPDSYVIVATHCNGCQTTKTPRYYLQDCDGGVVPFPIILQVDNTVVSGDVVSINIEGLSFGCMIVGDVAVDVPYNYIFLDGTKQKSCEACYTNNLTLATVLFSPCSDPNIVYEGLFTSASINQFNEGNFIFAFGGPECYTALEPGTTCPFLLTNTYYPVYYYPSCEICYQPLSAGTEYKVCVRDCSGTTFSSVSVPHPTWTNNQGKAIVLLDAVQLGGNGLYS